MKPKLLTVPEFCRAANIRTTKAYDIFNSGEIKVVKVGRKTLVPITELERWIESLETYKSEVTS